MTTAPPRRPRAWIAALLALLCNGLGHAYAGRLAAGVVIQAAWLALGATAVAALRHGPRSGGIACAAMLLYWLGQAELASRAASAAPAARRRWASRPLGLLALYVASVITTAALQTPFDRFVPKGFYQTAGSMSPTVQAGDLLLVDRRASIGRGAVVVHRPAGGRSADPLLKRVVGVAGDVVEVRDGRLVLNGTPATREPVPGPCTTWARSPDGSWREEPCTEFIERVDGHAYHTLCTPSLPCGDVAPTVIPAGHVFVLGDHRDHSADSRVYGPVPLTAIVGRATYVYFSSGPAGVRWRRMGTVIE